MPLLETHAPPWRAPHAGSKLRDVPPFEQSQQVAGEAAALPLPPRLLAAVSAALPINRQQTLADVPACRAGGTPATASSVHGDGDGDGGSVTGSASASGGTHLSLDPWLLLEGGLQGGGGDDAQPAAPPPWLEGAVTRRRRDLAYTPAAPPSSPPRLAVDEQLRRLGGGSSSGVVTAVA